MALTPSNCFSRSVIKAYGRCDVCMPHKRSHVHESVLVFCVLISSYVTPTLRAAFWPIFLLTTRHSVSSVRHDASLFDRCISSCALRKRNHDFSIVIERQQKFVSVTETFPRIIRKSTQKIP